MSEFTPACPSSEVIDPDRLSYDDANVVWDAYVRSFEELQTKSPTLQIMTRDDFDPAMNDPDVRKLIIKGDGGIESALIFSKIDVCDKYFPWISLRYFEHNYPDEYANGDIYYFVGLFSTPENSGLGNAYTLRDKLFEIVQDESPDGAIFVYDCCDHNQGFAEALHYMAEDYMEHADNSWTVRPLSILGSQTFYSISMQS